MATYTIKGRESGRVYTLEIEEKTGSPDEGFLNHFYESDEEPEIVDGVYMVDDESIEAYYEERAEDRKSFPPIKYQHR